MPKFTISKKKALEQFNIVKDISDIVSYSSKTNPLITRILEEEDCMFSVHLKNELKNIKDKSKIIFLAQGWNEEEINYLINKGINWFVVDNETDLDILLELLKTYDKKINLLLRVKLKEHSIKTERYFVFGMSEETIKKRIKELNKEKISNLGIHFHRKSQNMSEWNLQYEFENMFDKEVINKIDIVNIGGGIPSAYADTNLKVFDGIFQRIKDFKKYLNKKDIKMIIEPGRFISAPAGKLITKILSVHKNNIIVDASVYNSDMDALIVPVKLLVEGEKEKGTPYVIKGITPCSMDLFRYRVYLNNPEVGNEIIFLNAGAYNFTTDFCDLEKIETVIVE